MQEIELLVPYKIFFFALSISLTNFHFAQKIPDAKVDSLLVSGIENIINQQYDDALYDFTVLDNDYPDLPLAKIYLAACKIAEAYDLAIEYDSDYIESNLEFAKNMAEELIEHDEYNIWYNYYFALAEGYLSYYNAINDNWLSAISTGMNSITAFGTCLNIDSTFYEAYIGIGTYEYWMSRNTEFLNGLPFYNNEAQIGIKKLREAVDKSSYNSYLAINSLVWIYIDQQKYTDAIEIAQSGVNDFPYSRYFKWGLARAYEDFDPVISISIYNEILNFFLTDSSHNRINEITLKHLIAQQYFKIGMIEKSLDLCEEILSINNLTDYELSLLENRLERVENFRYDLAERKP
ncbi:hypothetical protein ACFLSS_01045 [Bacteroidota bacterium]